MIDLKDIIKSSEKVNIEVKAAQGGLPNSIWETYSSFANTFGGTIILGIGEDKETKKLIPLGISDADKMITDIWNILNNPQKVSKKIYIVLGGSSRQESVYNAIKNRLENSL